MMTNLLSLNIKNFVLGLVISEKAEQIPSGTSTLNSKPVKIKICRVLNLIG